MTISGVSNTKQRRVIYYVGSAGSATLDLDSLTFVLSDASSKTVSEVSEDKIQFPDAFPLGTFNIAAAIKAALDDGNPSALGVACTFEDGLYNQQIIGAIHKSN